MTAYRRPGNDAACGICGNGLDKTGAFYDREGRVVCKVCQSRGEVAVANSTLKRWKVQQSPAAYGGAVAVTVALVAVGWLGRWATPAKEDADLPAAMPSSSIP